MAYKVIILYQLYMPSYFLGTFTEYPSLKVSCCFSPVFMITPHYHESTKINKRERGFYIVFKKVVKK